MDKAFTEQLRADAAAGNKTAERFLIQASLAEGNADEIEAVLDGCVDPDHRRFLLAELRCFHDWPGTESWQDLLRQCASAGHREARFVMSVYREWAALSNLATSDKTTDDLEAADCFEWRAPEWSQALAGQGLVVERSGAFAPRAVIEHIRALLGPQLKASTVINPDSGQRMAHPVRINQCAQWLPEQLGWIGKLFETRLAQAGQYTVANGEVLSLLHYAPGQRYKAHYDCVNSQLAQSHEGQLQGGQRTLTVLLAMGDADLEGGETCFPFLKSATTMSTGELLRWNNTGEDGEPLRSSLHEGREVQAGEKWLLSKWVRERSTPYGKEICMAEQVPATN
jgi:hypothetical protein